MYAKGNQVLDNVRERYWPGRRRVLLRILARTDGPHEHTMHSLGHDLIHRALDLLISGSSGVREAQVLDDVLGRYWLGWRRVRQRRRTEAQMRTPSTSRRLPSLRGSN